MNFDNIFNAMLTLFILSTVEGYPNYMYTFVDADETGPYKNNNQWMFIYVIVFLFIGSMFLLNLFIGVI